MGSVTDSGRNEIRIVASDSDTGGFALGMVHPDAPTIRMYFSDWDDVQSAFNRDGRLLRFLQTGRYEDAGDD